MWLLSFEWLLCLVLVFWCVGVRRRLLRLRTDCGSCLEGLDQAFRQALASLQAGDVVVPYLSACDALRGVAPWSGGRSQQARHMARLEVAWLALQQAWPGPVQNLTAEPALAGWHSSWQQQMHLLTLAVTSFNQAVIAYNRAIAQFPAMLIARLLGMAPGHCLQLVSPVLLMSSRRITS